MANKILVIGATGTVGAKLVTELARLGEQVKAASRRPRASDDPNIEPVPLDLVAGTGLEEALEGVDRVHALAPPGHTDQYGLLNPVVGAAAARGIKVVLQTAMGVDADDNIPFRRAELALERSGAPFVILRPNWFTDNFYTFWGAQVAAGVIRLPAGRGATSFIDARDIAASAAAALTRSDFDNRAFNLTGPEALTYAQAASVISQETGRHVAYEDADPEAFVQGAIAAGLPEDYARFLVVLFGAVAAGWASAATGAVEELTGRKPRSVADYFRNRKRLAAQSS